MSIVQSFRWTISVFDTTPTTNPEQVDNMLLHHLTLNVNRGSKIAVVEKMGCGKSTLIKMIQGELPGMDGC
jgi:ABC-type transport system involved in cytochrome bd biosynthesis fused ATPase/permease subunit